MSMSIGNNPAASYNVDMRTDGYYAVSDSSGMEMRIHPAVAEMMIEMNTLGIMDEELTGLLLDVQTKCARMEALDQLVRVAQECVNAKGVRADPSIVNPDVEIFGVTKPFNDWCEELGVVWKPMDPPECPSSFAKMPSNMPNPWNDTLNKSLKPLTNEIKSLNNEVNATIAEAETLMSELDGKCYSTASVSSAGGGFYVTDSTGKTIKVDLGTLMMMVNMKTVENLDAQIAAQLDEMQARNDEISALNSVMNCMNHCKSEGLAINDSTTLVINGETMNLKEVCNDLGLPFDTMTCGSNKKDAKDHEQWVSNIDADIQMVKSKIDALNTDSQMDNIELQNLLDKRSNAFQMTTQTMNTNNESVEAVIRNL